MNNEKKLFNMLLDSEFLLSDMRASGSNFTKTPANLRRLLAQKTGRERVEASGLPGLALHPHIVGLQKAAETLRGSFEAELLSGEPNLSELSYSEAGLSGSGDAFESATRYIAACRRRSLAAMTVALQRHPAQNLRREILGAGIAKWDNKMESVIENVKSSEPVTGTSALGERLPSLITANGMSGAAQVGYLQAVHKFVQDGRWRERRDIEQSLDVSDASIHSRVAPPRRVVDTLLEELTQAAGSSPAAFVFPLAKQSLVEPAGSEESLLDRIADQAGDSSLRRPPRFERVLERRIESVLGLLQNFTHDSVRAGSMRQRLGRNPPTLAPIHLESLESLYYHFENVVFPAESHRVNLERDSDDLALWPLLWLALRTGQLRAVAALVEAYNGSFRSEARAFQACLTGLLDRRTERLSFFVNQGEDDYKRALSLAMNEVDGVPSDALVENLVDFVWLGLFQTRTAILSGRPPLALPRLQRKIANDMASESPLELVKWQLICLMFEDAVGTLSRADAYTDEAAQLAFVYIGSELAESNRAFRAKYANYTPRTSPSTMEAIILNFAAGLSRRYPVECLAYLDRLPSDSGEVAADFIEKNNLVPIIFGTSGESRTRAERAKVLLGKMWSPALKVLSSRPTLTDSGRDVARLRILEEKGDAAEVVRLMAEREVRSLIIAKKGEEEPQQGREFASALDRLFERLMGERGGVGVPGLDEVLALRRIRNLEILFTVQKRLNESYNYLDKNMQLFEFNISGRGARLRASYYELVRLSLKILLDFRDSIKSSHFRFNSDSQLESIRDKIKVIRDFYNVMTSTMGVADELVPQELQGIDTTDIPRIINQLTMNE